MQVALQTYKHEDKVLKVVADELAESPREWANLGTMVCWHRRYRLGDAHSHACPDDFWFSMAEEIVGDTDKVARMSRKRREEVVREKVIILPLYIYDHSGVIISTSNSGYPFSDPWDAGQVGWVYVNLAFVRKEFGVSRVTGKIRERAIEALQAEVEAYSQYLSGEVFAFIIEDAQGNIVDSCGGFYGYNPKENGMAASAGPEWFN